MTKDDRRMMILFLQTFRQELLVYAETFKAEMLKRSELDNVLAFRIASKDSKDIIYEMVDQAMALKGNNPHVGQEGLEADGVNQITNDNEGKSVGHAKKYASNHFRNDRNAA